METTEDIENRFSIDPSQWGSDEMNLAEFPIGVVSEKQPRGVATVEREDTAWCSKRKMHFPRKVIVTATDKWGLPCAGDNDVLLAIVSLTKTANNFSSRELEFSRAQIARELGWDQSGHTYRRIKVALHRLAGVRIIWERAFFDNADKVHRTKDTGVIDSFDLYERYVKGELFDADGRPSKLYWSQELFKSFGANYVKPLNMEIYRRLEFPVARQTYRLVDKRFHHEGRFRMKLREFSKKIGLTDYRYESKIKEKLAPSLKTLENNGVIRSGEYFEPTGRYGEHWVKFVQGDYERRRGRSTVAVPCRPATTLTDKCSERSLAEELRVRGVRSDRAEKLAAVASQSLVRRAIAQWDFLCSTGKAPKSAGWLASNIERGGYSDPPGFSSAYLQFSTQRLSRPKVADSLDKGRCDENEDANETEQQELAEYLTSLSSEARGQFESAALANAHPLERDVLSRDSSGAKEVRAQVLMKEYRRLHA